MAVAIENLWVDVSSVEKLDKDFMNVRREWQEVVWQMRARARKVKLLELNVHQSNENLLCLEES